MTTYNTGNPIGSKDPRDLYDNAENLDTAVNDTSRDSWSDRLGRSRKTMSGMEREFDADQDLRNASFNADQADRDARFKTFISSSGYQFLGDYAAGIEITEYNQIVRDADGEFWRLSGQVELPYTTTGDWGTEEELFVAVGDASIRQEITSVADANPGSALIGMSSVHFSDIPSFLEGSERLISSKSAAIVGTFAPGIGVGGIFYWDEGAQKSQHNGGTVIDPDRSFPANWSDASSREAWFAKNSATGQGCWIRFGVGTDFNVKWFGAVGDGVFDDTVSFQAAVNSLRDWGSEGINSLYIPSGTYSVKTIDIPTTKIGCSFHGDSGAKLVTKEQNLFTVRAEAQSWVNISMEGPGTYSEGSVLVLDQRNNDRADVDWGFNGCSFTNVERIGHCFGRGVTFRNCFSYAVRTSWLRADFPDPFWAGEEPNHTLEEAFRGFLFEGNRKHYDPCYFLENLGHHARHIQGVMIRNNWLEGSGRMVLGYLRNALITGNHSYNKHNPWETFRLTGVDNVRITGNVFFSYGDQIAEAGRYFFTFLRADGEVNNLSITDNHFNGLEGHLIELVGEHVHRNINIIDNSYKDCFHSGSRRLIRVSNSNALLENLVVRELIVNNTGDPGWVVLQTNNRATDSVINSTIDVIVPGSTRVDDFPWNPSNTRPVKHGTYTGNGASSSPRIDVGYSPLFVKVYNPRDNTTSFKSRHAMSETPEIELAANGFYSKGQLNESGTVYVYEAY